MKIFLTSTTAEFLKYKKNYFKVRQVLIDEGHILTRDWIPHAEKRISQGVKYQNPQDFFPKVMQALDEAEAIVVEDTVSNFSTGFAITYAIQRRKPILVLWFKEKNKHFKDTFLHGITDNYLEIKTYTLKNIDEILKSFLKKYENSKEKNRFHLVIDGVERKYLDWIHFNKNLSRTEIIRKAIRGELENDQEYQNYLKA